MSLHNGDDGSILHRALLLHSISAQVRFVFASDTKNSFGAAFVLCAVIVFLDIVVRFDDSCLNSVSPPQMYTHLFLVRDCVVTCSLVVLCV